MSVLLRQRETGNIIYYVKGAEIVMERMIRPAHRMLLLEYSEQLAVEGLRALVFAQKVLTEEELEIFMDNYKTAQAQLQDRDYHIEMAVKTLESNLTFLGVSGVEDKLQKNVQSTIDSLKNAGIQVWMLTGDRVETGVSIAISSGLKSRRHELFFITDDQVQKDEVARRLVEFRQRAKRSLLIIDGKTLDLIFESKELMDEFFHGAILAPALCVCRCSPTQKADIVRSLKTYIGDDKRVAAIGDGGNDVGMILEADVGIGIVGKEGMQAALASDFSINQFSYIKKLILWHGRQSYRASAVLSQFVFHRGLIISVI